MIKIINWIRSSLAVKIFLLTFALLFLVSGVTYFCISRFLPAIYTDELTDALYRSSEELKGKLEEAETMKDALSLLPDFEAEQRAEVVLWDENWDMVYPESEMANEVSQEAGEFLDTAFNLADGEYGDSVAIESRAATDEIASLKDDEKEADLVSLNVTVAGSPCILEVTGTMDAVSQVRNVLFGILPYLAAVVTALALICAFLSALYLARPIRRISGTSRKMAGLDFSNLCNEKRKDEVGVLSESLNELSQNLSRALFDLKEANEQLKTDIEKEREAEKRRMDFFAAVSHELKTPVTILKGHLSGMKNRVGAYRNRDFYLSRSLETVDTMENLVQEILTVARVEAGRFPRKLEYLDVSELVRQQLAVRMELLEEKDISYQLDIPEHLKIREDRALFDKVLGNLFSNAYRYTPIGGEIRIFLTEQEGNCVFSIENTGVHLPPSVLPRLFEPFYRAEESRNRETGGSGLGLYLTRSLLEQAGGTVKACNTEEGVRFTVVLNSTENT